MIVSLPLSFGGHLGYYLPCRLFIRTSCFHQMITVLSVPIPYMTIITSLKVAKPQEVGLNTVFSKHHVYVFQKLFYS